MNTTCGLNINDIALRVGRTGCSGSGGIIGGININNLVGRTGCLDSGRICSGWCGSLSMRIPYVSGLCGVNVLIQQIPLYIFTDYVCLDEGRVVHFPRVWHWTSYTVGEADIEECT